MVHFTGSAAARVLRCRQLSFFLSRKAARCDVQVQIVPSAIYQKHHCLLIAFPLDAKPGHSDVSTVADKLRKDLDLKEVTRFVATAPIVKCQEWFRPGGDLHKAVKDLILSPGLRETLSRRKTGDVELKNAESLARLFDVDRPPMDFVLWTRQSNEHAKRSTRIDSSASSSGRRCHGPYA